MNQKTILSGAMAAAVLSALSASAQFDYQNGDLIAAFGNGGSTDVIVDLGSIANYQQAGGAPIATDLSSVLTAEFGSVSSSLYWAVFGVNDGGGTGGSGNPNVSQNDPNTIWATKARSNPSQQNISPLIQGSSSAFQLPLSDIETIAYNTSPSPGNGFQVTDLSSSIAIVPTSVGTFTPMMTGPYSGNFQNEWAYNVLNDGAGTSDLFQNDPAYNRASYLGDFNLSSAGVLTFNPVPEPSAWAMMGSGILALIAIRRRK